VPKYTTPDSRCDETVAITVQRDGDHVAIRANGVRILTLTRGGNCSLNSNAYALAALRQMGFGISSEPMHQRRSTTLALAISDWQD
jgi:hypothetical protein